MKNLELALEPDAPVRLPAPRLLPGVPRDLAYVDVDSPVGLLRLIASAAGLSGVHFLDEPRPACDLPCNATHPVLARTAQQLEAYWQGRLTTFDLPLAPRGTDFQRRVWEVLLTIDLGRRSWYGAIAGTIDSPRAVRAVGGAVGRNPLAIIVPCHRVLGRDGSLTGFAGGLERKRILLRHEGYAC